MLAREAPHVWPTVGYSKLASNSTRNVAHVTIGWRFLVSVKHVWALKRIPISSASGTAPTGLAHTERLHIVCSNGQPRMQQNVPTGTFQTGHWEPLCVAT